MKKFAYIIWIICFPGWSSGQEFKSLSLIAQVSFNESSNDIWGFVDQTGEEYAIIGTRRNTRIFSLADPYQPREVLSIEGVSSTWRDIKSWGDYIYAIADQGSDGLLIIDMSNPSDSIPFAFYKPEIFIDGETFNITKCHNLYADEGYLYLAGCNVGNKGVAILDLVQNPMEPVAAGMENQQLAHDVFVQNNLMFVSEISRGQVAIYDISDLSDIQLVNTQKTGFTFTHNTWASDDGKTLFTTDERSNAFVESYDITNLDNIRFLDRFRPDDGLNTRAIPHNAHYHNGYLFTSWYTDGVIILDAAKPDNLVKIAQFDTWDGPDGGFNGNWGAYPFLPSGLLLLSDIDAGLFVLEPQLSRAAYLEGIVRDANSQFPVHNVHVQILGHKSSSDQSSPDGIYKTGVPGTQLISVEFKHPEYHTKIIDQVVKSGDVSVLDVALEKRSAISFSGYVFSNEDLIPIKDAQILISGSDREYFASSDENGYFTTDLFSGPYEIFVGRWGYELLEISESTMDSSREMEFGLSREYRDDFIFDFGWTSSGNASSGKWIRDIPEATLYENNYANVNEDIPEDVGNKCYMTGNGGGNPGTDDVDNGEVVLHSPIFDLSDFDNPILSFYLWFFNGGSNGGPNDSLIVSLTNSIDTIKLEVLKDPESQSSFWQYREFELKGLIELTGSMQLIVETRDDELFHVVEGGFDGFLIREGQSTSVDEPSIVSSGLTIYPNPTRGEITIDLKDPLIRDIHVSVFGLDGRKHFEEFVTGLGLQPIQLPDDLPPAIYLVKVYFPDSGKSYTGKIVRIHP